jgi:histidinol-phosphate aminotransferase
MSGISKDAIRADIAQLSAYHVQAAAGFLKLDAMENPYPLPEEVQPVLQAALADVALNRYPSPAANALKIGIREAMGIAAEQEIMLGNGSDEIIQIIAIACASLQQGQPATMLSVEPAFVMFKMIALYAKMQYIGVPLQADFSIDVKAMLQAIETHRPAVTFIAYPNNPTGNLFTDGDLHTVITAANKIGGLVVIDEAYFAFSARTFLHQLGNYTHVVLMRTVSKLGLAGLRLGMLIGAPQWLNEFEKVRLPYNINVYTQAAGLVVCKYYQSFTAQAALIVRDRALFAEALAAIDGVEVFSSEANFLLVRVANSQVLFDFLLSKKILVKHTGASHPLMRNTLRITVGMPDENAQVVAAVKAFAVAQNF